MNILCLNFRKVRNVYTDVINKHDIVAFAWYYFSHQNEFTVNMEKFSLTTVTKELKVINDDKTK
ncbi:MAG: hypothetical protein A3F11_07140 [Gammaproteobacteria bacterium RIFCSPHIGHO2_12_FULL_37_14]|nr:MAG: hypothetical protein A3F11_07140 [Gammaproteobacteria bacterium RIFCSPHIGHO2_12_FULL_37_14]